MTARTFYEACAIGYQAIGLTGNDRSLFRLKTPETEEEHLKYGGITPKELYYMYADGRDDGLQELPLDDAIAFSEWLNKKEPYYKFNGSHPWEIITSFSTSFSMHLSIARPYVIKDGKFIERKNGFFFYLSGDDYWRSIQTIKFYLALINADYKVKLDNHEQMKCRFTETDDIRIIPAYTYSPFSKSEYLDCFCLTEEEKSDKIISKAIWDKEKTVLIK